MHAFRLFWWPPWASRSFLPGVFCCCTDPTGCLCSAAGRYDDAYTAEQYANSRPNHELLSSLREPPEEPGQDLHHSALGRNSFVYNCPTSRVHSVGRDGNRNLRSLSAPSGGIVPS